jgi:hypothetical protein
MVEPLRHRQTKGTGTDMLGLTPPRHTSTLPIPAVRFAQTAVIPGRLRQGALKPFATRYPGKVLYPKSSVSRAGRRALAASTRSGFEVMKRRLLEAGQRLGGVMRSATAGMV